MKKIVLITISAFIGNCVLSQITLKECIEKGLAYKPDIKIAKSDLLLESLKRIETKGKYLPQITIAYDYRYNPIIATQIIPVGQLVSVPTDETRAIQFGTDWQQNAGVTVYQPILDLDLKNRLKEDKLNESISKVDLSKKEDDLEYEIVKTYLQVLTINHQVEEAISDTVRSYISYNIIKSKFIEGKVLKTELNTGLFNHNNNIILYKKAIAQLFNEKVYLQYLTNIDLEQILDNKFVHVSLNLFDSPSQDATLQIDGMPEFQRLLLRQQLVTQQIKTEKAKYLPTVGVQGFLGANQFTPDFAPFQSNSWFGSSYLGLFVKLPIFSPEKSVNGTRQLENQLSTITLEKEEFKLENQKQIRQIEIEIQKLKDELAIKKENMILLTENVTLFQQRINDGQVSTSDLNLQEAELQKVKIQINQFDEQLNKAKADRLFISGELSNRLKTL